MKGWWPLFKKEIMEQIRTNRLLIVAGVFLFFGLTTPLTIKYLPEIIKQAGEGMQITIPPPTALQSLSEFSSTILQLGILVLILVGMGTIANEYKNGLLALFLMMCISLTVMFSALFKSGLAAGGLAMAAVIVLSLLSTFPWIGKYLPGKLPGWGLNIMNGSGPSSWWALGTTLVLMVVCLYFAQLILKKKEV